MFLIASGLHFGISSGLNLARGPLERDYKKQIQKHFIYPTLALDLKFGYRFQLPQRWFIDYDFLDINLSPNFQLASHSMASLSITTLRFGKPLWRLIDLYGIFSPCTFSCALYPNASLISMGACITLGAGIAYRCCPYVTLYCEIAFRQLYGPKSFASMRLGKHFTTSATCTAGLMIHLKKHNR